MTTRCFLNGAPEGSWAMAHAATRNNITTSFILSRVVSTLKRSWGSRRMRGDGMALRAMLACILPPLETPSRILMPRCVEDNIEEEKRVGDLSAARGCEASIIVEPKTGFQFPTHLAFIDLEDQVEQPHPSCQVLAGVGVRIQKVLKLKSIKIYAFGLSDEVRGKWWQFVTAIHDGAGGHILCDRLSQDVQPDLLRAHLGEKYKDVSPEELTRRPDFFDDLLSRHEVDMTVRLVVHYKGLKMGQVRSAFEESLGNRLKKIRGGEGDEGLRSWCSYLSDDIHLFQGSTIDIRWQPGGNLQTEIGGRQVGSIHSLPLCQAFFDLYIGEPPVCENAKQTIGVNLGRMLKQTSC